MFSGFRHRGQSSEQPPPPESVLGDGPGNADASGEGVQIQPSEVEASSESRQVLSKAEAKERRWKKKAEKKAERKRRNIEIGGSLKIEGKKGGQAEQEPVGSGLEVGVKFRISKEYPEPERVPEEVAEEVAGEVVRAVRENPDFTEEEKKELRGLKFIKSLKEKVKGKISKGALVDFAIGFGAGFGYKALVGSAVRTGVKRAVDLSAPGMGAVVGAATGASYEFIKTTIQEVRRKKEEKQDLREKLEGKIGVQRLEGLLKLREEESLEELGEDSKEIYEQLKKSKINWSKVGKATLRGAVVGGIGGAIGGAIADRFNWGGDHVGAGDSAKNSIPPQNWAGNNSPIEGFAAAERVKDVSAPMKDNVWNTVKLYLEQRGVSNPSNEVINHATRIITDANNVEITGDHAQLAAEQLKSLHHHITKGVLDTKMQQGFKLLHFDKLNDLIKAGGGEIPKEQIAVNLPKNLPGAGAPSRFAEMTTSWVNSKNLYKILGVLGAGAAFEASRRLRKRKKKTGEQQDWPPSILPEKQREVLSEPESKLNEKPIASEEPGGKEELKRPVAEQSGLEVEKGESAEMLAVGLSNKFKEIISLLQEALARTDRIQRENLQDQAVSLLRDIDGKVDAILDKEERSYVQQELRVYFMQVSDLDKKIIAQDKEREGNTAGSAHNKDEAVGGSLGLDEDYGDSGSEDDRQRKSIQTGRASQDSGQKKGRLEPTEKSTRQIIADKDSVASLKESREKKKDPEWLAKLKAEGKKKLADRYVWALLMREREKGGLLWVAVDSGIMDENSAVELQKFLRSIENYQDASSEQINKLVGVFKVFIEENGSVVKNLMKKLEGLGMATKFAFTRADRELKEESNSKKRP